MLYTFYIHTYTDTDRQKDTHTHRDRHCKCSTIPSSNLDSISSDIKNECAKVKNGTL